MAGGQFCGRPHQRILFLAAAARLRLVFPTFAGRVFGHTLWVRQAGENSRINNSLVRQCVGWQEKLVALPGCVRGNA